MIIKITINDDESEDEQCTLPIFRASLLAFAAVTPCDTHEMRSAGADKTLNNHKSALRPGPNPALR
jgi:hypothetical protein